MDEKTRHNHLFALAKGMVCRASMSCPNGTEEQIKAAVDDVARARRLLAKAVRRLDHLLGHPWLIGPCDCHGEDLESPLDKPYIPDGPHADAVHKVALQHWEERS